LCHEFCLQNGYSNNGSVLTAGTKGGKGFAQDQTRDENLPLQKRIHKNTIPIYSIRPRHLRFLKALFTSIAGSKARPVKLRGV
jgi:hypothetical protein